LVFKHDGKEERSLIRGDKRPSGRRPHFKREAFLLHSNAVGCHSLLEFSSSFASPLSTHFPILADFKIL
jgi:hypothetical protein